MARRRPQRPRDPSQLGKMIVDLSTGAVEENMADSPPTTAQEFARLGGTKGGVARAAKLSSAQRVEIARKAAQKRWSRDGAQPRGKDRRSGD